MSSSRSTSRFISCTCIWLPALALEPPIRSTIALNYTLHYDLTNFLPILKSLALSSFSTLSLLMHYAFGYDAHLLFSQFLLSLSQAQKYQIIIARD